MTKPSGKDPKQPPEAAEREPDESLSDYARLVAGLVHDFRTQLGSIVGAASVLDDYRGGLDEKVSSKLCAGIIDQAHRIDQLITALAAIGRARSNSLVTEVSPLELNELLRGFSARMRDAHNRVLRISVQPNEIFLKTDPAAMQTALSMMAYFAFFFAPARDEAALALERDGRFASISFRSALRDEESTRLDELLGAKKIAGGAHRGAEGVCLAAIREVVHSLGGELAIQHDKASARLCQTVRLPIETVSLKSGKS